MTDVREALKDMVTGGWSIATNIYGTKIGVRPPVVDFYTRGTAAGKAYRHLNKVEFNVILAEENVGHFHLTVLHELAHIITYKLYPYASAHGREFKNVLLNIGGNGQRCHSYDAADAKWVTLNEFLNMETEIFEDHYSIIC